MRLKAKTKKTTEDTSNVMFETTMELIHVLMATLLGTVVTVLVAWTKFRYETGSPSFGTKSVGAYLYASPNKIGRYDR